MFPMRVGGFAEAFPQPPPMAADEIDARGDHAPLLNLNAAALAGQRDVLRAVITSR